MADTLTNEQIDRLSVRELRFAIADCLPRETLKRLGDQYASGDWYIAQGDTDAAVALLAATGWLATIKLWRGTVYVYLSKHLSMTRRADYYGSGDSVAEAALRCWLKWKVGQG